MNELGEAIITIVNNIYAFDLDTIGLIFGFFGALLVAVFGLPSISLLNDGSYSAIVLTPKMKCSIWISRFGLVVMAVGFIFQLLGMRPAP
jgi:uncharacterized membrane protein YGL010W